MGAAENRRLMEETIQAMDDHDAERLAGFYAEDAVRETVGMAVQRGREEIQAFYQMAFYQHSRCQDPPDQHHGR